MASVEMLPVESSWIASIGYADGTIYLETEKGETFEYPGTESQFKDFLGSPSKGKWFRAHLK